MKAPKSQPPLLLLVRLSTGAAAPGARLQQALDAMQCALIGPQRYECQVDRGREPLLRDLAEACTSEAADACLHAPLPLPTRPDEPYRRLQDRTDDYAAALAAWRAGQGPIPLLLPGELMRL